MIYICKGDDTGFNEGTFLTFILNTSLTLTGWKAEFILDALKISNIDVSSKTFTVNITRRQTTLLNYGKTYGRIVLYDSNNMRKTMVDRIPFYVTDKVVENMRQTITYDLPDTGIEIELNVAGIPTKTSELINDSNFLSATVTNPQTGQIIKYDGTKWVNSTGGGGGTEYHNLLLNRDMTEQHPISAITNLQTSLDAKQPTLTAGSNIAITNNVISATDTTYTAGTGIAISENNVISNTQTSAEWGNITGTLANQTDLQTALNAKQATLTAGTNIQINDNTISATDTTYTAGSNIAITNNVISFTGVIPAKISDLTDDTATYPVDKADTLTNLTASVAELNILDGATLTTEELNYVDGVTSNIQTQLNAKQATLTAGTNIQINDNTISATDTTYTAGTNISIVDNTINFTGTIPTKTSDLTNDSGFITKEVNDLTNYTKTSSLGTLALKNSVDYTTEVTNKPTIPAKISDLTDDTETYPINKADTLTGLTATVAELNILDGITASTEELNYVDGVTSNIQTQLNAKQATLTAGSNINITNNVISATDTTYTAGTGISITDNAIAVDTATIATKTDLTAKQDTLVSGTNIKTVNNNSLLGSGNITIETPIATASSVGTVKPDGTTITVDGNGTITSVGGGGSEEDNVTITKNSQNKIQTVGVIDQNSGTLKYWSGTQAQYDAIATKDNNTIYNITNGSVAIVGANIDLSNLSATGEAHFEKPTQIATITDASTITLADNTIYNSDTALTALTIAAPSSFTTAFNTQISFSSGATATTWSAPATMTFTGNDCTGGVFTPVANKRYTIVIIASSSTALTGYVMGM